MKLAAIGRNRDNFGLRIGVCIHLSGIINALAIDCGPDGLDHLRARPKLAHKGIIHAIQRLQGFDTLVFAEMWAAHSFMNMLVGAYAHD